MAEFKAAARSVPPQRAFLRGWPLGLVSTSMTALIAGSIAWLAAGTAIPTGPNYEQPRSRLLMPYELFQRLVAQTRGTDYAVVAPIGSITSSRKANSAGRSGAGRNISR